MEGDFDNFSRDVALLQSQIAIYKKQRQDLRDLTTYLEKALSSKRDYEPVIVTFKIPTLPKPHTIRANSIDLSNNQAKAEHFKVLSFYPNLHFLAQLHRMMTENLDKENQFIQEQIQKYAIDYANDNRTALLESQLVESPPEL